MDETKLQNLYTKLIAHIKLKDKRETQTQIILNVILKTYDMSVWIGYVWLKTLTKGGLF